MFASRFRHIQRGGGAEKKDIAPSKRLAKNVSSKTARPEIVKQIDTVSKTLIKTFSEPIIETHTTVGRPEPPPMNMREWRKRKRVCVDEHSFEKRKKLLDELGPHLGKESSNKFFLFTAEIMTRSLVDNRNALYQFDSDVCVYCKSKMRIDNLRSQRVCPRCAVSSQILFTTMDCTNNQHVSASSTFIRPVFVRKVAATKVPETPKSDEEDEGDEAASTATETSGRAQYMRTPLYSSYLRQFHIDMQPIPESVMKVLYIYLSSVHLLTTVRAKPTPIATILRANRAQSWAAQSVRIAMEFNGQTVPKLSAELIKRLVERFEIVTSVASSQSFERRKNQSFEYLTNIFLHLEGRSDLAACFSSHKTRSVLRLADDRFQAMLPDVIRASPVHVKWEHCRRAC